jgi:hypothetical protein
MRILAIERPVDGAGPAQFTPELAAAEARRAWDLHQAGVSRELYFQADQTAAVLMLEYADVAAAEAAGVVADGRSRPDRVRGVAAASLLRLRTALSAYFRLEAQGRAVTGPGM